MGNAAEKVEDDGGQIAVRDRLIEGYLVQVPTAIFGLSVLLVLNFWYYNALLPAPILNLWIAFMLVGLAGYCATAYLYRFHPSVCFSQRFLNWTIGHFLLLGLGWGGIACYAIEHLSSADSFMGAILVAGVVGAATATNAALPVAFKVLAVSSLGPLAVTMLMNHHSGYNSVGVGCLVYLLVMLKGIDLIHDTLRRSIELGLTNAELVVSLEKQSNTDVLTGLMNRRGLNRGFDSAWNRGLADQSPLGLVLCDVDNFKAYNDALGHQAGDACLEQIGMALRTGLRANDTLVARYGGEEFAILVTNSSPDGILKMGERVRDLIANLQIQHPASSVAGHVTISVGVSQLQPSAQTKVEVLLNSADDALYRAKASGRNCVQFVAPEPRNKTISNRPSSAGEVSDNSSKAVWCSDSYKFL